MLKKYLIRTLIIMIVINDVINLSNNLSVVESFKSTSGSNEPRVDDDIVINRFEMLAGCVIARDIKFPQVTCVFFSILSP